MKFWDKKKVMLCLLLGFLLMTGCNKNNTSTVPPNDTSTTPPVDTPTRKPVPASFAKGADVSWLTQMESSGYLFYDSTGKKMDCMALLKTFGINSIRLRAWVNPSDGWCNTADLVTKTFPLPSIVIVLRTFYRSPHPHRCYYQCE